MDEKRAAALLSVFAAGFLLPAAALGQLTMPADDEPAVAGAAVRAANPECAAQNIPSGGTCTTTTFCSSLATCKTYCCCACDRPPLAGKWWDEPVYGTKVTCENGPQSGTGIIAPDSADLLDLGTELRGSTHLLGLRGRRATQAVVDALRSLNTIIADWPDKPGDQNIRVRVHNCYRRAVGNPTPPTATDGNAEAVCGMVFKLMHVENSPTAPPALKTSWANNAANVWRMAWPGASQHSAGFACDIVLVDGAGADCFDSAAGPSSGKTCSIDSKAASVLLDEAVTQTGGRRLDFEAWHYEWGGRTDCRCQFPACGDESWPPTGTRRCVGE